MDTDGLIEANNHGYAFDLIPGFWDFLAEQAEAGHISCPVKVYNELTDETYGPLRDWAIKHRNTALFTEPSEKVQTALTGVADHVRLTYQAQYYTPFLAGADPWLVAHLRADGGLIVTNETLIGINAKKVKIPNVCSELKLDAPITLYEMARRLGWKKL